MKIIISEDQNTVTIDGTRTDFKETKKPYTCRKCWWREFSEVDCNEIPCLASERKDRKYGVFTIQNMPNYD